MWSSFAPSSRPYRRSVVYEAADIGSQESSQKQNLDRRWYGAWAANKLRDPIGMNRTAELASDSDKQWAAKMACYVGGESGDFNTTIQTTVTSAQQYVVQAGMHMLHADHRQALIQKAQNVTSDWSEYVGGIRW